MEGKQHGRPEGKVLNQCKEESPANPLICCELGDRETQPVGPAWEVTVCFESPSFGVKLMGSVTDVPVPQSRLC